MRTPGWKDEGFLDFVRQLPCAIHRPEAVLRPWDFQDGTRKSEPDHLPVLGLKAIGMKSPDAFCWPACRECHEVRATHYRTPWTVYSAQDCMDRRIPIRFARVNFYELTSRLMWAYAWQRKERQAWVA